MIGTRVIHLSPEDLRPVDLAQHHVATAHGGDVVDHPPAVAVEHRQGVQQHVAVVDPHVPAEREGVDPAVAGDWKCQAPRA